VSSAAPKPKAPINQYLQPVRVDQHGADRHHGDLDAEVRRASQEIHRRAKRLFRAFAVVAVQDGRRRAPRRADPCNKRKSR